MSRATNFNAITYQNKLKEAGINQIAAEVHASQLSDVLNMDIATKHDIAIIRQEIINTENKMVIKLGSLVVGCTFIISIMIGVFGFWTHK